MLNIYQFEPLIFYIFYKLKLFFGIKKRLGYNLTFIHKKSLKNSEIFFTIWKYSLYKLNNLLFRIMMELNIALSLMR